MDLVVLNGCTLNPHTEISLNPNKVFSYHFDKPVRTTIVNRNDIDLSAPQNNMSHTNYYSANGYFCRRISGGIGEPNIMCFIDGSWQLPANIGINY